MKLVSANSRLFTPIEMRLSTLIREYSAIIFALTEYEFLLTIIITNTTIADQAQGTQTTVTQDNFHHTTEIITIIITITTIDKDIIVKIQTKVIDTDNDQALTIDII